jgi:acylphosphatase
MSCSQSRLSFEVRGKVQGVFFRKYRECSSLKADELGLTDWVKNKSGDRSVVLGEVEGD